MSDPAEDHILAILEHLGIHAPEEDIPFLKRAFLRQRDLLQRHSRIPPDAEPAHILRPVSGDRSPPS